MAEMTKRMKDLFNRLPSVLLTTAAPDGMPNSVPIGSKKILDDNVILFSDQFMNKTLANMKANPKVAVTFWEGFEGYQLKGTVTIETKGARFEETAAWIEDLGNKIGFPMKSKGAIIMNIEAIYGVSPGPGAGKQLG